MLEWLGAVHAGPEEEPGAVPSGCAAEEGGQAASRLVLAQLPWEGGIIQPRWRCFPSAMLQKEVRKLWVVNFTLKRKKVIVDGGQLQIFTRTCVFIAWLFLSVPGLWASHTSLQLLPAAASCPQNSD